MLYGAGEDIKDYKMKRAVVVAAVIVTMCALEGVHLSSASASGSGAPRGCQAEGSIGGSAEAHVACGGSHNPGTPGQPKKPKPGAQASGDTFRPADNDFGYITCPNKTGPTIAYSEQEYGPNGKPIGTPQVLCLHKPLPAPPPPPKPADVWADVPLPRPTFAVDPKKDGITQLASWFWVTPAPATVTATVEIDGYTVTTTATPVAYQWNFGDGSSATSTEAGGPDNPSVTNTYHYKGTYTVTLSVEYAGAFSYAGFGVAGTESLGDYEQPGVGGPYVVQEVRSVLVPLGER